MIIPNIQSSSADLMQMMYQSYVPKILNTAIDVNLFEALSHDALSLSELSGELNTDKSITEALLDVLIAIELVEKQNSTYHLTQPARDFLLENSEANQIVAVKGYSGSTGPFDNLEASLLNGAPEFDDRMWNSREAAADMEQQNKGGSFQAVVSFLKETPGFETCTKMCDFAGSTGYFSFAFMQENAQLRSHVYDLPEICALARQLKEKEEHYDRITYHGFDVALNESFGEGYDLFFSSHFLYEFNVTGVLVDFFKKVNRSLKPGGLFISNHITPAEPGKNCLALSIVELMTRAVGYPTHQLPEEDLKSALSQAGFGKFRTKRLEKEVPNPILLLAAVKTEESV